MKAAIAAIAMVLSACAPAPARQAATNLPSDCAEIDAAISRAEHAQREADQKRDTAWKAVIPFAVAARHANGSAAAAEAGRKLKALRAEQDRRCAGGTS